ncbi:MAG TPA: histidine kinase [Flavisolibacter sp.]|nr:histidine kinase [Flavisolibacter sp.]
MSIVIFYPYIFVMMSFKLSRYWLFQLIGWGLFALINIFFALAFNRFDAPVLLRIIFYIEVGIIFSHLMREFIHRKAILLKKLGQQIISFFILTIIFSFLVACVVSPYEEIYDLRFDMTGKKLSYFSLLFTNFISFFPLLLFWNAFYFMYHFIMKSRKHELDTIKLEALVRELELKTIKAHINPHFIFNALNGIRAMIDENPARARKAVTELSNILRSSLTLEKVETVTLEDELKIVKDYLALESMRFEKRLTVEFEIDIKTLSQQVPPMMLQILVENAIKHGISKQTKGGIVKIISDYNRSNHEIIVQNTGSLNGNKIDTGFGVSSTRDRLNLLYGDKAQFEVKQIEPALVEAKVVIPVTGN